MVMRNRVETYWVDVPYQVKRVAPRQVCKMIPIELSGVCYLRTSESWILEFRDSSLILKIPAIASFEVAHRVQNLTRCWAIRAWIKPIEQPNQPKQEQNLDSSYH